MSLDFLGMKIIQSKLHPGKVPVLKVSPTCPCSDEMRASMDKWLLETFGEQENIYIIDPKALGMSFDFRWMTEVAVISKGQMNKLKMYRDGQP